MRKLCLVGSVALLSMGVLYPAFGDYLPEAQTVGAWVFGGTVNAEGTGTIPNLVPASVLVCENVVSNEQSNVAPPSTFVAEVPGVTLWSDCWQTNRMADLSTSLRLKTSSNNGNAASFLQIRNFGRMISACPDDTFTIEMIVRVRSTARPFVAGMTGCSVTNTPALAQTGYYVCAPTNTAASTDTLVKLQPRSTAVSMYRRTEDGKNFVENYVVDGNWHHLAYSWDGTAKKALVFYDYDRARDSYTIAHCNGEPLGYDDDSYWQIGGSLRWEQAVAAGCGSVMGAELDVVAVRVSKGLLSTDQFMCVNGTAADPDVVGRFTFESVPVGTLFGRQPERNLANANFVASGLFANAGADQFINVYTNFTAKAGVREGGTIRSSHQSLWSGAAVENKFGLYLNMIPPPRFLKSPDFTVEALVYPVKAGERCLIFQEMENSGTVVTNAFGTWPLERKNDWGSWGLGIRDNGGGLYLGLLQEDDETGAVTNVYNADGAAYAGALKVGKLSYDAWHHVAVSYDGSRTNTFRLWVDYELVHAFTFPEGTHLYRTTMRADPLLQFFGGGWNDNASRLHGCVQDLRVTCRALSAEEFLKPTACGMVLIFR